MNAKNCGRRNVRKHKEIRGSDNYVTLDISWKFDSIEKMKITSSESKGKLKRSGKGLIISMCFKAKVRLHKYKKWRYAIGNVSNKDLSKIIREFENCLMKVTRRRVPNMRLLTVNLPSKKAGKVYDESRCPQPTRLSCRKENYSSVLTHFSTDEDKSKEIILNKNLSQSYSMNEYKCKGIIVNKTLSQIFSTYENESKGTIFNKTLSQSCYTDE